VRHKVCELEGTNFILHGLKNKKIEGAGSNEI